MRAYDKSKSWGTHSVWFSKNNGVPQNSFRDFRLFPKNRNSIVISEPNPINEEFVGRDSSIDWYDILGEESPLKSTTGSLEFYVIADFNDIHMTSILDDAMYSFDENYDWIDEYDKLNSYFDGSLIEIWIDADPGNVYVARVTFSDWSSPASGLSEVTLNYTIISVKKIVDFKAYTDYATLISNNSYITDDICYLNFTISYAQAEVKKGSTYLAKTEDAPYYEGSATKDLMLQTVNVSSTDESDTTAYTAQLYFSHGSLYIYTDCPTGVKTNLFQTHIVTEFSTK